MSKKGRVHEKQIREKKNECVYMYVRMYECMQIGEKKR